ncbi:penicillin-binding protein 2 [Aquabacterium sp. OR-4]|uniref:penicillin-binding protein 2 n=1 Tax=Aquabacterium sp. OR-4 TaxID=2978127 RepID=UPI0021B21361|nr:penicillin-binding protein 2 [Aquabacterium sp. OR-4]MDT7833935.1 penicillin-binding protein 2 [Aquabacterium sp. OR-4]
MTELKDLDRELGRFRTRLVAAALFVLLGFGLLGARLWWLQVVRHDELAEQAEANRIAVVPTVPNRGLIVDRHGVVLATNYSAYTLEITPAKVQGELERVIDALAEVVEIAPKDRRRFKRLLDESKSFESLPIRNRLSDEELARFTAQRYRFPGVDVRARLFRTYPLGETGAHLVGYIGRINTSEKKAMEDWDDDDQANYRGTEVIGKLGLEQRYERELHGTTGFDQVETSAGGRAVRRLGSHPATPGNTLALSVDIRLQHLVEELFGERRGALVAIDPRTGEVLAFVSKPSFDPNLFVDGIDVESWRELNESIDKPLLNRALRSAYPPGSTYKPFMSLAALATGKRTPQQAIADPGYFNFGNHRFRDDKEGGHGVVDMYRSIVQSCDTYYYVLANEMGVDLIAEQMAPFGFGQITGIDLDGEVRGVLPSTEWKKRAYRKPEQKRWYAGETISIGIGQGYNNYTILQLAHATATLAAGGQRHTPHLVRQVVDVVSGSARPVGTEALPPVPIRADHLEVIRRALVGVNVEGTSASAFRGAAYQAAGKTGTAQVVAIKQGEKYNAAKLAEHLRDHALYMAYAPAEAPQVAVALIVENAGFGAQAAAPIARRVFDYVLQGQWPSVEDIAATRLGQTTAPIGSVRRALDVALPGQAASLPASAASAAGSAPAPSASASAPASAARVALASAAAGPAALKTAGTRR